MRLVCCLFLIFVTLLRVKTTKQGKIWSRVICSFFSHRNTIKLNRKPNFIWRNLLLLKSKEFVVLKMRIVKDILCMWRGEKGTKAVRFRGSVACTVRVPAKHPLPNGRIRSYDDPWQWDVSYLHTCLGRDSAQHSKQQHDSAETSSLNDL